MYESYKDCEHSDLLKRKESALNLALVLVQMSLRCEDVHQTGGAEQLQVS
jgi:hypothetical protein